MNAFLHLLAATAISGAANGVVSAIGAQTPGAKPDWKMIGKIVAATAAASVLSSLPMLLGAATAPMAAAATSEPTPSA